MREAQFTLVLLQRGVASLCVCAWVWVGGKGLRLSAYLLGPAPGAQRLPPAAHLAWGRQAWGGQATTAVIAAVLQTYVMPYTIISRMK